MRQTILKSVVAVGILALGAAACSSSSSSPSSSGSAPAKTGQPLVIESTPLSPMTDNFNPLSSTSTGFLTNSIALYNEPLYIWNYLRPTDPGIPELASGQPTFSNGGKTLQFTSTNGFDGTAPVAGPVIRYEIRLAPGESLNGLDDNGNGLIDESILVRVNTSIGEEVVLSSGINTSSSSFVAAIGSMESMLSLCFRGAIVAGTVFPPMCMR